MTKKATKKKKPLAGNSGKTAKRGPGRPFEKGQSGNPAGRPKVDPDVRAVLKAATLPAALRLVSLLNAEDEAVALRAAQDIINRELGKIPDHIKLEDVTKLSDAELFARVKNAIAEHPQESHMLPTLNAIGSAETDLDPPQDPRGKSG